MCVCVWVSHLRALSQCNYTPASLNIYCDQAPAAEHYHKNLRFIQFDGVPAWEVGDLFSKPCNEEGNSNANLTSTMKRSSKSNKSSRQHSKLITKTSIQPDSNDDTAANGLTWRDRLFYLFVLILFVFGACLSNAAVVVFGAEEHTDMDINMAVGFDEVIVFGGWGWKDTRTFLRHRFDYLCGMVTHRFPLKSSAYTAARASTRHLNVSTVNASINSKI